MTLNRREIIQGGMAAGLAALAPASPALARMARGAAAGPTLGVCYYPEQWPRSYWKEDATDMARRGIVFVRIGEFDWALIEPEAGRYDWAWLDEAVATLARAGLKVVMGTPTATPPKWLVDRYPEILPVAEDGAVRGFGWRRHCTLSSQRYWAESRRIVSAIVERYGQHPGIAGWQIDNELGCHDTLKRGRPF